MADTEQPETKEQGRREGSRGQPSSSWKMVDRKIWAKKIESHGLRGTVSSSLMYVAGLFASTAFLLFIAAPIGGLGAYLSVLVAYDLGGISRFGLYLVGIWSVAIVGIVAVLEKSGYSRNFHNWDLPLRRLLALPIAFLAVAGMLILALYLHGAFP
jgi:hypothetical protein